jgi:hypothetical protein
MDYKLPMLSFISMICKKQSIDVCDAILNLMVLFYWTCIILSGSYISPYAPVYKKAYEIMRVSSYKLYYMHSHIKPSRLNLLKSIQICISMQLHLQQAADARRYNLPTVEEIAAVVPGDGSENVRIYCDIILCLQGGGLCWISNLHPFYLPLHYVLFFLHGEEGWHLDIPL